MTSSLQTHLTRVRPRELLYSRSGVLRSWDPMVVETWIEMLKEKLKHISSLLRLGASIDAFLEA
jgi:vacuolar-type H+-ATPase subunit E/Vma4